MHRLGFTCPTTRHAVDPGLLADDVTLLHIKKSSLRVACGSCSRSHLFAVEDGTLSDDLFDIPAAA
jgi:hypothetical protein